MDLKFLDFEQPIAELEAKIDELRFVGDDSEINISDEIERLKAKSEALTRSIFANLSSWQVAQLARHPLRPYTLDYLEVISPDFQELHGDRANQISHLCTTSRSAQPAVPCWTIGSPSSGRPASPTRRRWWRRGRPRP